MTEKALEISVIDGMKILEDRRPAESEVVVPDFLARVDNGATLILEVKGGRDEKADVKAQAAERWVAAVNADGRPWEPSFQRTSLATSERSPLLGRALQPGSRPRSDREAPRQSAEDLLVQGLVRAHPLVQVEVCLGPPPRCPSEGDASFAVLEQLDQRGGKLRLRLRNHDLLSILDAETVDGERRRDHRLSGGECLQHLHPHSAAGADRRGNDRCGIQVRRNRLDIAGDGDRVALQREHLPCRL